MYHLVTRFMRHMPLAAMLAMTLLTTASCNNSPPPPRKIEIGFTRYQPIALDVANIEVIDEYKSPMKEPNVEHLIPVSPTEAMHVWVKDRLRAVGLNKTLQVIIKNANVVATDLPQKQGVDGLLTDPGRQYDAKLEVELRVYGGGAMSEASIYVTAHQMTIIPLKANLLERDARFRRMIFDLMEAANAELERQIFKYFNNQISYSQTP